MSEHLKIQQFNSPLLELSMIQYPGKVNNVDNAIKTLGGAVKVSQAICGDVKKMSLRLHSANPYNKAILGEKTTTMGLLLSFKIYKSKKKPNTTLRAEIIGYCNTIIGFDSLCDFQYTPLSKSSTSSMGCFEFIPDSIGPRNVTDASHFEIPNRQLFCIPQLFARSDSVSVNIYHHALQSNGQHEVLGVLHKTTYDNRDVVTFNMTDAVPLRPDPLIVKRMKIKYVSDEQFELIKKLFDDCPVWTRIALLYESGVSNDKLKCIIPSLAYYFSNGPWRTMFVRYGYDPRKDFKSRYYQTFDYRLRFRSGVADLVEKRQVAKTKKLEKNAQCSGSGIVQDVDYPYFDESKLPRSRQCIMRYSDIRMPKIQAMIAKIPTPMAGATCNERTGWLPEEFDRQIRQILTNVMKDLMNKHSRKGKKVPEALDSANTETD